MARNLEALASRIDAPVAAAPPPMPLQPVVEEPINPAAPPPPPQLSPQELARKQILERAALATGRSTSSSWKPKPRDAEAADVEDVVQQARAKQKPITYAVSSSAKPAAPPPLPNIYNVGATKGARAVPTVAASDDDDDEEPKMPATVGRAAKPADVGKPAMPTTVGRAKAAPGKSQWLWKGATTPMAPARPVSAGDDDAGA